MSFEFIARDGGPLPRFEAGQHLPVELRLPGQAAPLPRSYSLSGPPGADSYRLSVRREARGRDADFYLCGPPPFLADIGSGLAASGVPAARIQVENF